MKFNYFRDEQIYRAISTIDLAIAPSCDRVEIKRNRHGVYIGT